MPAPDSCSNCAAPLATPPTDTTKPMSQHRRWPRLDEAIQVRQKSGNWRDATVEAVAVGDDGVTVTGFWVTCPCGVPHLNNSQPGDEWRFKDAPASAPDLLARAAAAEAARDENYAKYRAAIVANEEWHKEVTDLRAQLEAVTKQRDALAEHLRAAVMRDFLGGGTQCTRCLGTFKAHRQVRVDGSLRTIPCPNEGPCRALQAIDAENKGGTQV